MSQKTPIIVSRRWRQWEGKFWQNQFVWGVCVDMLCLVFSKYGAGH